VLIGAYFDAGGAEWEEAAVAGAEVGDGLTRVKRTSDLWEGNVVALGVQHQFD
jgi:hypothetical protein